MAAHVKTGEIGRTARHTPAWIVGVLVVLAGSPAEAFLARPAIFAPLAGMAKAPGGWQQFCRENPEECRQASGAERNVTLTPELLEQLYSINGFVNKRVTWTSDEELYGKSERWALPLDRGDCEDIVLLKRRLLAKAGWPVGSLLITTVEERLAAKGRHAVLTVRTDKGELILDNQTPEILFWYETPYNYLSRQSAANPNEWVAFGANQKPMPAPSR